MHSINITFWHISTQYLNFDRFASNKGDFPSPYFTIISQWVMQIPLHEAVAQCAPLVVVRGLTFQHVVLLLDSEGFKKVEVSKYLLTEENGQ